MMVHKDLDYRVHNEDVLLYYTLSSHAVKHFTNTTYTKAADN